MLLRKNDSGRSIVEMLGVLAIMGVITVMGISGYSQAIGKINRNNVTEDIVRIAQEVRGLFAAKGDYIVESDNNTGNNTGNNDNNIGEILDQMKVKLATPYGGKYKVVSNGVEAGNASKSPGFIITLENVPATDCAYFKTMAWTDAVDGDFNNITNAVSSTTNCAGSDSKGTIAINYR